MSLTVTRTKSEALIPALTSSLAQLQPAMQQTQESLQGLVVKVTDALARSEERGRKLEAELIAEKSQHAADKAGYKQRLEAQESLMSAMQGQVHEHAAQIAALKKSHFAFVQRYNTHQHSHVGEGHGLGTLHTSAPGLKRYAGRQGCLFDSHGFPEPKFDENKKA